MNLMLRKSASLVKFGARSVWSTAPAASFGAVQKLIEDMKGWRAMPWESSVTEDAACELLSAFWGIAPGAIQPGDVLDLSADQMEGLLVATASGKGDAALDDALFTYADSVTRRFFGNDVYFRGIVEFSNVCENDCFYCGIRKHQPRTWRYTMPVNEVIESADWAFLHGMGTLMLQSGQLDTPERNAYIEDVARKVRERTVTLDLERHAKTGSALIKPVTSSEANAPSGMGLCVALSVGELPASQYRAFRDAGAERYLLRIETSNPNLYAALHPPRQTWDARLRALQDLKDAGFQVGTGVMVGLPGQTMRDLAGDIVFFREMRADMIGCGPYITEAGTPTADAWEAAFGHVDKKAHMAAMLKLTTRVNALTRITLGNVNIAATTALQAIDPLGRELALRRGANILMPILTPTKYREHYTLYEGKPCITDTAAECENCLKARLSMVGKSLRPGVWGDPPSYRHRLQPVLTTGGAVSSASHHHDRRKGFSSSSRWAQNMSCENCGAHPEPNPTTTCKVPTGPSFTAAARSNGPAIFAAAPRGSDVPRTNLGIFGKMNSGKSTLMNRLTRSEVSIVDSTPGTTSDTKIAMMELHAAGPVKLFDTAGVDEIGVLGDKKRRKVLSTLKECDVAVIVVNLPQLQRSLSGKSSDSGGRSSSMEELLHWEKILLGKTVAAGAAPVLVFNTSDSDDYSALQSAVSAVLDPDGSLPSLALSLADPRTAHPLGTFLERTAKEANAAHTVPCLPEQYLSEDAIVFLNIPMDAETPSMRLLRPQALVQEEAIRKFATTYAYRMNLDHARSSDPDLVQRERQRFLRALAPVLRHAGPALVVTDSQAVDVVHPWTLDPVTSKPLVDFTTFSIAMIHRQSRGDLPLFAAGIQAFKALKPGDRVLVAEACNHNRITELCNDIGMVQIPRALNAAARQGSTIYIEHAFGREFPELDDPEDGGGLRRFALAVHCGGCMVDAQKMRARISDLREAGVPVTNYGMLLAYAHSPEAMQRALEPWGVQA